MGQGSLDTLVKKVREALGSSDVEVDHYSGHSFRTGAATTAAMAGVEDSLIRPLGRWRSAAYLTNITTTKDTLASVDTRRFFLSSNHHWSLLVIGI